MSSITLSNVTPRAASAVSTLFWKRLWRADAIFNLALSDGLIFAAGPIRGALDMPASAVTPLRVLGGLLALYGLLQLWLARHGEPPRRAYQLAALDMTLAGIGLAGVLIAGVAMNTVGIAATALLCAGSLIMAALWIARSRQIG